MGSPHHGVAQRGNGGVSGSPTVSSRGTIHDPNGENFRFDEVTASRWGRHALVAIGGCANTISVA
jgi:hypothetical protein